MPPDTAEPSTDDAEATFTQLFLTAEGRANPYPLYHRLHQTGPVRAELGMWVLGRPSAAGFAVIREIRVGGSPPVFPILRVRRRTARARL